MTKHRIQLISSQNVLDIHLNSVTLCKSERHLKLQKKMTKGFPIYSAGNNFSLFTGHMSFKIFLLVGHLTNWAGHKTLTDNAL